MIASSVTAMASQSHLFYPSIGLRPIARPRVDVVSSYSPIRSKPNFRFSQSPSLPGCHYNPSTLRPVPQVLAFSSSSSLEALPQSPNTPPREFLSGSTRTVASIVALALSLSSLLVKLVHKIPLPVKLISLISTREVIWKFQSDMVSTMGPLFFAALRDRPSGFLNTPLTVVAAGLSKWLDIYSGVLMVRVLLSWFPNIPWERQPLSAIRDLCDPYLNLFRNIIPPVFNTLDVSPLLAFAVLGTLGSILSNSRAAY
ncbi:hypothetical protein L6164_021716 [Bauhinia variegata]|uniref:Uncharacterized protein n=1 Tax=Bauhinia variegata TaxID=167791 RepID=A0ACB9MZ59_BAUVA|nr:hypothetical protein L6164_021716 [Bauhinia variegata]